MYVCLCVCIVKRLIHSLAGASLAASRIAPLTLSRPLLPFIDWDAQLFPPSSSLARASCAMATAPELGFPVRAMLPEPCLCSYAAFRLRFASGIFQFSAPALVLSSLVSRIRSAESIPFNFFCLCACERERVMQHRREVLLVAAAVLVRASSPDGDSMANDAGIRI